MKSRQQGFTLLEVVIAVALLGTALVAVAGLLNRSLVVQQRARALRLDSEMAAEVMAAERLPSDELRRQAEDDIRRRYPDRTFQVQSLTTEFPDVLKSEVAIYRDRQKEPAFRLTRYLEAKKT
jgi:prepilin-type N-terminal cleavage/methylation domain-containing protein